MDGLSDEDKFIRLRRAIEEIARNFGEHKDANYDLVVQDGKVSFGEVTLDRQSAERMKFIQGALLCETPTTNKLLKKLAKAVLFGENVLLVGATGGGKTNLPRYLSDLLNHDYTALDLDGQTDISQLIGQWLQVPSGGYEWQFGGYAGLAKSC